MKMTILMGSFVFFAAGATTWPAVAQTPDETDLRIEQLGPGPFLAGFDSLDDLVSKADAVVIATVETPGRLTFVEADSSDGVRKNVMASAVYGIEVKQVLAATPTAAVSLKAGALVEVRLRAGRESARAVRAGQNPVKPGDECLLFLFNDRDGWSLIAWHFQFRRSQGASPKAQPINAHSDLPPDEWFGPGVVERAEGRPAEVGWSKLVASVIERGQARLK